MYLRQRELQNSTLRFCNDVKIPWFAFKGEKKKVMADIALFMLIMSLSLQSKKKKKRETWLIHFLCCSLVVLTWILILSRQKKKKKACVDWHAWCCLFALLSYLGVTSCKGRVQKQVMGRMNEGRKRRWTPDSLLPFLIKLVTLTFA